MSFRLAQSIQKKAIDTRKVKTSKTHEVIRIPAHLGMVNGVGYSTQFVKAPHEMLPAGPQQ